MSIKKLFKTFTSFIATSGAYITRKSEASNATIYVDYDNIAYDGLSTSFHKEFPNLIKRLVADNFSKHSTTVKIYGNFAYHFPGHFIHRGRKIIDPIAFSEWQHSLPDWCEVIDTPVIGHAGKTDADPLIMREISKDCFNGKAVGLFSNDKDFRYHMKDVFNTGQKAVIFTNKRADSRLLNSIPKQVNAKSTMLDLGFSPNELALKDLTSLPLTLNYQVTRHNFDIYSRKNWFGKGSFEAFMSSLSDLIEFDFSEDGRIHIELVDSVSEMSA